MDASARILGEKVRVLYAQGRAPLVANVVNGLILVWYFAGSARSTLVMTWAGALVLLMLARVELLRRFERRAPEGDELLRWRTPYVVGAAATGALWGIASLLYFDPDDALAQTLLTFVIGGMATGAAATLSSYLPAFVAFVVPALLPLVLRTFAVGDELRVTMGMLGTVYGVVLLWVARVMHRTLERALELRFENRELVDRLSALTTSLEQSNRTLEQRIEERTAEIDRQAAALREAQHRDALGRLAGGVAHDFNNLFTVVIANASALAADARLPEAARAELEEIQVASTRGASLVRQLLAFSGKGRFEPRVVDLTELAVDTRMLLDRLLERDVRIELDFAAVPLPVLVDPVQLQQALVNLVTNARDAMPNGGTLRVGTAKAPLGTGAEERPGAELWVSDTGVGMAPETLLRAFEPFFTTKGPGSGSGLGLPSVQAIVDRSGGKVTIDSKPGQGSRVTIALPLAAGAPAAPAESEPASRGPLPPAVGSVAPGSAAPSASATAALATVLLAEDEAIVRSVTARMLRRLGYSVLIGQDGLDALAVARAHPGKIDLLVTDVLMPRMGGVDLAAALRAERPAVCVLFVSGYERDEKLPVPERGIGTLRKPYTPSELGRAIAELLAG